MPPTTATPVTATDRSIILDILRGFALLGICIANYAGFSLFIFQNPEQMASFPTATIDKGLAYFHFAFIDGKFYSLFSLLFGIGFSIILLRNQQAGRNPLPLFYRRLLILALIGLAHALLLWDGDILFLYALLGMLLPLFRKCSDKTLLVLWAILIFSPLIIDALKVVSKGKWDISNPVEVIATRVDSRNGITENNYRNWLVVHDDYRSILKWTQGGFFWRWEGLLGSNRLPKVLGMFLLGLYVGRNLIYARLEENIPLLKKVQRWGFVIGLPASLAFAWFHFDQQGLPKPIGLVDTLFYAVSVVPLSLAYTATLCLLWLKPAWKKRLEVLAPAGRMALTNYLLQSVLGILIFYGIGLGLGAKTGPALFIPIALGVYCVEVACSHLWLRYFRYGPVEWIWRQLTYGKKLKLRRETDSV